MKFIVLSSGSKGNTTYIESGNTKILIDIGNNCRYVSSKLKGIGIDPRDINGILITHTHSDHVKGLKVFLNKYNTRVYSTKRIIDDLDYVTNYEVVPLSSFKINDLSIDVIKLSHDAPECVGYIINDGSKRLVYITDTGYINERYFPLLDNANAYILESNHDIELLSSGKYPFRLRQRILGDKGHLSNYDCSRYVSSFMGSDTKYIILAHLSEENNTEELAYNTLMERLSDNNQTAVDVLIARQDEETRMVEV